MEASRTGIRTLPLDRESDPSAGTTKARACACVGSRCRAPDAVPLKECSHQCGSSVEGAGQLGRPVWAALIVGGKATS